VPDCVLPPKKWAPGERLKDVWSLKTPLEAENVKANSVEKPHDRERRGHSVYLPIRRDMKMEAGEWKRSLRTGGQGTVEAKWKEKNDLAQE